jgi:DNA-binding NtrC family response regulator
VPLRLSGTIDGRVVALTVRAGTNLVGAAPECDLRLDHPTVSRRHARLEAGPAAARIEDLGSSNGTFVNGRRVERQPVEAGDRVTFGRVELVLESVDDSDVESALALPPRAGPAAAAPAAPGSTVGTQGLEGFALDHLPGLVRRLAEGATAATLAQPAGAALFAALPCVEVEVRAGEGVLFQARREMEGPGAPVEAGGAGLRVYAAFPHARTALLYAPLVETVADLLGLAGGNGARAPRPSPAPALPDPPTVVPELQRLYAEAALVARGEVGLLIGGESGTGKEVLARYVHAASPRAAGPFVALNCAALPRDLLEAELFGIERGVATGVEARPGKFELAHGGTLFLDEIGDMALDTQARILRVLQEREVYRIGGQAPRKAAVRVVAATNRDVPRLLAEGRFREDLYYRIASWTARLPALRERRADIPNLAAHFLAREGARRGVSARGISRAALDALISYAWPGNVRQLENEMSRAALFLAEGDLLDTSRLSAVVREPAASAGGRLEDVLQRAERDAIARALLAHDQDVTAAAQALGLGRSTLYRRMKALGLSPEEEG